MFAMISLLIAKIAQCYYNYVPDQSERDKIS